MSLIHQLFHQHPILRRVSLIAWLCGIAVAVALSLAPGDAIGDLQGSDKLWHGGGYFLLGLPVWALFSGRRQITLVMLALVGLGAALEVLQLFVPRRSFEWADMVANTMGVVVGVLVGAFFVRAFLAPLLARALQADRIEGRNAERHTKKSTNSYNLPSTGK